MYLRIFFFIILSFASVSHIEAKKSKNKSNKQNFYENTTFKKIKGLWFLDIEFMRNHYNKIAREKIKSLRKKKAKIPINHRKGIENIKKNIKNPKLQKQYLKNLEMIMSKSKKDIDEMIRTTKSASDNLMPLVESYSMMIKPSSLLISSAMFAKENKYNIHKIENNVVYIIVDGGGYQYLKFNPKEESLEFGSLVEKEGKIQKENSMIFLRIEGWKDPQEEQEEKEKEN